MRDYMVRKIHEPALKMCEYTVDEPIALKNMNYERIIDLVSYYIVNDDKYKLHSRQIMGIIQESHLDGFTIREQIEKGVDIEQYLYHVIGDYANRDLLSKIAIDIMQNDSYSEQNTQTIAQKICMFSVDNLRSEWLSKQTIDGVWIIAHIDDKLFVKQLRSVTALDADDCLQIHKFLLQYHVKRSEDEIRNRMTHVFTNY
eukprot:49056_1